MKRVDDDSSSLDRDELYVYIEDKVQTDGFIQRAVSITSIHNEGRNTSVLLLKQLYSLLDGSNLNFRDTLPRFVESVVIIFAMSANVCGQFIFD